MRRAGHRCCQVRSLSLQPDVSIGFQSNSAVCAAASAGHEGAVQFLLKAGADVNARTKGGRSALHYVASKGHARVAKVLIEAGINSLPQSFVSILTYGICVMLLPCTGRAGTHVRESLYAGADVRAADVHKSTPLHRACSTCKEVMVDLLIDAGASLAAADENGDTAMHVAVEFATDRPSAQAAFQLAAKGAALQAKNKAGQTPISLAGENADALQAAAASFARDKLG